MNDNNPVSGVTDSTPGHPDSGIVEPERLAEMFHEAYERLAPDFGYETRPESAVPWDDVPEQNKAVMVAACADLGPLFRSVVHGCCVELADARSEITTRDAEVAEARDRASAMRERWSETWASPSDCAEVYPFPWESADAPVPADPPTEWPWPSYPGLLPALAELRERSVPAETTPEGEEPMSGGFVQAGDCVCSTIGPWMMRRREDKTRPHACKACGRVWTQADIAAETSAPTVPTPEEFMAILDEYAPLPRSLPDLRVAPAVSSSTENGDKE